MDKAIQLAKELVELLRTQQLRNACRAIQDLEINIALLGVQQEAERDHERKL